MITPYRFIFPKLLQFAAVLGIGLTLIIMWTVTDFAHSLEDIAVLFYALLASAPYFAPLRFAQHGDKTKAQWGLYLFGTGVISLVGLYAYYHAFFAYPNDHSGFLFLFVPLLQGLGFLGLDWAVAKNR